MWGGCIPRAELTKSILNVRLQTHVRKQSVNGSESCKRLTLTLRLLGKCRCHMKLASAGIHIRPNHNPLWRRGANSSSAEMGRSAGIALGKNDDDLP